LNLPEELFELSGNCNDVDCVHRGQSSASQQIGAIVVIWTPWCF